MTKKLSTLIMILTLSSTTMMAKPLSKMDLIHQAQKEVGEMSPEKLKKLLDDGEEIIVLDVRETEQRAEGSIPSDEFSKESFYAITRGNLEWEVAKKIEEKDALIVTYCRKGGRGALASSVLRKMGYKNATTLKGGLKGWAKAGFPVQTGLGTVVLNEKKKIKK